MRHLSSLAIAILCAGLAQPRAGGQAEATTLLPLVPERVAGFQPEQCSISKRFRLMAATRVDPASGAPLLVVFDAVEAPASSWRYEALTYLSELAKTRESVTVVLVDPDGTHMLYRAETDPGVLAAAIDLFTKQERGDANAAPVPFRQREDPERQAAIHSELAQLRRLLVSGRNLKDAPTRVQQQLEGLAKLPALFGERSGRKAVVWITPGLAITIDHRSDLLVAQESGVGIEQQLPAARLLSTRWQESVNALNRANVSIFVYRSSAHFKPSIRDEVHWFRDPEVDEMLYRSTGGAELRAGGTLAQAVKEAASKLDAYYQFTVAFEPPGDRVRWMPAAIKCKGQGQVGTPKGFFALGP